MAKNYDYSYEWDIKYCYPSSFTLRNKFNITNWSFSTITIIFFIIEITSINYSKDKKN